MNLCLSHSLKKFSLYLGIEEAMDYLKTGGKNQYTTVQMLKGFESLVRFIFCN